MVLIIFFKSFELLDKDTTSEVKPSMEQSAQRELQEGHKTDPLWIQESI